MNFLKYLGIILLLIGAGLLIYLGVAGMQSNTLLVVGFALTIVGFLLHIFLDKKYNTDAREN
ncbi:MAG: hypothetical protein Q4D93_01260 [Porphyromonas sp.]|nr:hypothetical protein [Porphyromonas sp.]